MCVNNRPEMTATVLLWCRGRRGDLARAASLMVQQHRKCHLQILSVTVNPGVLVPEQLSMLFLYVRNCLSYLKIIMV